MTLQESIIREVRELDDPEQLRQLSAYLHELKKLRFKNNKAEILQLAGILSNEDAEELKRIIGQEFNHIEGEW